MGDGRRQKSRTRWRVAVFRLHWNHIWSRCRRVRERERERERESSICMAAFFLSSFVCILQPPQSRKYQLEWDADVVDRVARGLNKQITLLLGREREASLAHWKSAYTDLLNNEDEELFDCCGFVDWLVHFSIPFQFQLLCQNGNPGGRMFPRP